MRLENIITKLEQLTAQVAQDSLFRPSDPTAYGYGVAVGQVRGLQRALDVVKGELEDEDERERNS